MKSWEFVIPLPRIESLTFAQTERIYGATGGTATITRIDGMVAVAFVRQGKSYSQATARSMQELQNAGFAIGSPRMTSGKNNGLIVALRGFVCVSAATLLVATLSTIASTRDVEIITAMLVWLYASALYISIAVE